MNEINKYIKKVLKAEDLSIEETQRAFQIISLGGANPSQISAFITALHMKGYSRDEIVGGASTISLKNQYLKVENEAVFMYADNDFLEEIICVALILSQNNIPTFVKVPHQRRESILDALGMRTDLPYSMLLDCLNQFNLCILMSPRKHPFKHFVPVLREIDFQGIISTLQPIIRWIDPVKVHVADVLDSSEIDISIYALRKSGIESGIVCYNGVGKFFKRDKVESIDYGFNISDKLLPYEKAARLHSLFYGEIFPNTDAILMRCVTIMYLYGIVDSIEDGMQMARQTLTKNNIPRVLEGLSYISNIECGRAV